MDQIHIICPAGRGRHVLFRGFDTAADIDFPDFSGLGHTPFQIGKRDEHFACPLSIFNFIDCPDVFCIPCSFSVQIIIDGSIGIEDEVIEFTLFRRRTQKYFNTVVFPDFAIPSRCSCPETGAGTLNRHIDAVLVVGDGMSCVFSGDRTFVVAQN